MFPVPKETQDRLDEAGASYRLQHQGGSMGRDGISIPPEPGRRVKCEILGLRTGAVITDAYGPTEPAALDAAVGQLAPNHTPATVADMAAENQELRKRLDQIEKKGPAIQSRVHAESGGGA